MDDKSTEVTFGSLGDEAPDASSSGSPGFAIEGSKPAGYHVAKRAAAKKAERAAGRAKKKAAAARAAKKAAKAAAPAARARKPAAKKAAAKKGRGRA